MASYSLSGLRKDACNGHSVIALSVDGAQVFCFIGWMQHTCDGMPRLTDLHLNFARGFCGLPVDRRLKFADHAALVPVTVLMIQRNIVRAMMPMHLNAEAKAYAIHLQELAAHHCHMARVHVANANANPSLYCAEDDRQAAIREQVRAARAFERIAGVRGLFDTACMDDAHAVECKVSRIGAIEELIDTFAAKYRERAFNAYGRYAMYCARASVAPYAFPEWFADCYMGHETDPAANWN